MLTNLQIKDFLLIEELELDFFSGLTVITGETGSGKSIMVDALLLVFGAKISTDIIRAGQTQASFTASFQVDSSKILSWLQEKEFIDRSEESTIICRRIIDNGGRSKAYINSIPVNISTMKELGEMLLDIHTQYASIALLKPDSQRSLLDEFAGVNEQIAELGNKYKLANNLQQKLNQAREFSQDLLLKQEILTEKINDLSQLSLHDGEWNNLQVQQKQLANAEFTLQELDLALNLLNSEQTSIAGLIASLNSRIHKISEYIPNYSGVTQILDSIDAEIGELGHELQTTANKIEQNPQLLSQVDNRVDEIYSLARKYRILPEEMPQYLLNWQKELANLIIDTDLEALNAELEATRKEYLFLAQQISEKRKDAAIRLNQKVNNLIQQLSIDGEFKIHVSTNDSWSSFGIDNIQYQVRFNQGMALQPLNKVASGGELSRVALALYVTLSINNPPELIVFDEIDVGIGGGVAEVVGTLLKELGISKQVLCITHQPQTACCGDFHIQVSKSVLDGKSQSQIKYIDKSLRVHEIARMLGGLNITNTTLEHAKEMLQANSLALSSN